MSLIETIRTKLVNYKAELVEFPYEFKNKEIIHLIKTKDVFINSRDFLSAGDIVIIDEYVFAIGLDKFMFTSADTTFIDLFIDFENNMIAFTTSNTTNFCFDKVLLPTLHDENMYLAKCVAKEVILAILAMRLIS